MDLHHLILAFLACKASFTTHDQFIGCVSSHPGHPVGAPANNKFVGPTSSYPRPSGMQGFVTSSINNPVGASFYPGPSSMQGFATSSTNNPVGASFNLDIPVCKVLLLLQPTIQSAHHFILDLSAHSCTLGFFAFDEPVHWNCFALSWTS